MEKGNWIRFGYAWLNSPDQIDLVKSELTQSGLKEKDIYIDVGSKEAWDELSGLIRTGDTLTVRSILELNRTSKQFIKLFTGLEEDRIVFQSIKEPEFNSFENDSMITNAIAMLHSMDKGVRKSIASHAASHIENRGRKKGAIDLLKFNEVVGMLLAGKTYDQIEQGSGVSRATISRYKKKALREKLLA